LIAEAELAGFFARPMGTFENVSYAASAELVALGTAIWWLGSGPAQRLDRWLATAALLLALAAGLATVSATFLAGAPLVALAALACAVRRPSWGGMVILAGAAVGVGALAVWALDAVWGGGASFEAQVDRVRTVSLFANRYSSGEGVMADAIRAMGDRPWFGWGLLAGGETFFSDSLYVFVGYTTGAVGAILLATLLVLPWAMTRHVAPLMSRLVGVWAITLLLAGLGAPSVFVPRLMEWWWALVGVAVGMRVTAAGGVERRPDRPLAFGMPSAAAPRSRTS
jgi:hypothetical protein